MYKVCSILYQNVEIRFFVVKRGLLNKKKRRKPLKNKGFCDKIKLDFYTLF